MTSTPTVPHHRLPPNLFLLACHPTIPSKCPILIPPPTRPPTLHLPNLHRKQAVKGRISGKRSSTRKPRRNAKCVMLRWRIWRRGERSTASSLYSHDLPLSESANSEVVSLRRNHMIDPVSVVKAACLERCRMGVWNVLIGANEQAAWLKRNTVIVLNATRTSRRACCTRTGATRTKTWRGTTMPLPGRIQRTWGTRCRGWGSDREEESGVVVHRACVERWAFGERQFCKLLKKKTGVLRILEKWHLLLEQCPFVYYRRILCSSALTNFRRFQEHSLVLNIQGDMR